MLALKKETSAEILFNKTMSPIQILLLIDWLNYNSKLTTLNLIDVGINNLQATTLFKALNENTRLTSFALSFRFIF